MKKEAKMLLIRSEDSLAIPLHNLSQEKQRSFQIERKDFSKQRKLMRQQLSSVFLCDNSAASSNKLMSPRVLFPPY